ncbi:hypothetical protein [Catenuloplanes atrovinosus]|uniref:Uncharacterized protein n=1 Tax=Catenuloplanes atrovinosus TaxID=137266 RepID=A0AAE3YNN1_9ACTN|nr:hypothetical protein [Catenuloplanes atrovinosus]MDR7275076.1 hypothetical protein [Catenuloplanes atrovinosus]
MDWTLIATTGGGAVSTLLGVVAGGLLGRRSQDRQWLRETKAAAYRELLREYTRIEFDVRRAYLGQLDVRELDWPRWGAAVTELTLVADEPVAAAAHELAEALVGLERYVHTGDRDDEHWRALLHAVAGAQVRFVNAARRSLSRRRRALTARSGGPLITG